MDEVNRLCKVTLRNVSVGRGTGEFSHLKHAHKRDRVGFPRKTSGSGRRGKGQQADQEKGSCDLSLGERAMPSAIRAMDEELQSGFSKGTHPMTGEPLQARNLGFYAV